jgi:hypothetical protein
MEPLRLRREYDPPLGLHWGLAEVIRKRVDVIAAASDATTANVHCPFLLR